jgi:hypothetical protein
MLHLKLLKNSRRTLSVVFSAFALAGLGAGFTSIASAAEPGDPPRWYKPDTTQQERIATSRKEAYAAYKEALQECARLGKNDRGACVAEAKATLQHDLDYAQRRRAPQTVGLRFDNEADTPASLVRRHLALMMLEEGACATR